MRHLTILFLFLCLFSFHASAQTVLGKHPADQVEPGFWGQNGNANTTIDGLNSNGTHQLSAAVAPNLPFSKIAFPMTGTNVLFAAGFGADFLNTPFYWNSAFNIDGSGGAYTNNFNELIFFDAGQQILGSPVWGIASNDVATSQQVWAFGTFSADAVPSPGGEYGWLPVNINTTGWTYFPFTTNTVQGSYNPSLLHVYVATNGWNSLTGWVTETNAGQSLQDALGYYGLAPGGGTNSGLLFNVNGYLFYTNGWTGGTFELGPAPPWVNPFYLPQGFTISNQVANSSWEIYGQGPNTCIVGDSNVLQNWTAINPGTNVQGGPIALEHIHHLIFCVSNYQAKAFAVNLYGNGYLAFDYNQITAYVGWRPDLYFGRWAGGDSLGTMMPQGYCPGFIDLLVTGNNGDQWVHNNVIANGAVGEVTAAEHQRIADNEWKYISTDPNGHFTNQWATNDTTMVWNDDAGRPLFGSDIALGSAIIVYGEGDCQISGDKTIAVGSGVHVIVHVIGGDSYGPIILFNCHFEANSGGNNRDIIVDTNNNLAVVATECWDQQRFGNPGPYVACSTFDPTGYYLSTNLSTYHNANVFVEGQSRSSAGQFLTKESLYVNNYEQYYFDPFTATFWVNPSWTMVGNGHGVTNIPPASLSATNTPQNGYVARYTNSIAGPGFYWAPN